MTENPAALAARLHAARSTAAIIDVDTLDVASVEVAYAVQAELIRLSDGGVRGWKVSALSASDQAKFNSTRPVAGAMLGDFLWSSPATLPLAQFVGPLLECEIAFVLGTDLPARSAGYRRTDIEAAIHAVVPVFEFADGRVPAAAADLLKLADSMNSGGMVTGTPCTDWRALDLTDIQIALRLDGEPLVGGSSARILGDPVLALLALANAYPLPAPLRAGQIVTTGTCTTPVAVGSGRYVGSFAGLSEVEAHLTP